MGRDEVASKLRTIFATVLELPESSIVPELSPDGCEKWDSLHHIHIVSAIQETFGLSLEIEAQVEILTFELGVIVVCEALAAEGRLAA
jgi:acyl carrier protein